MPLDCTLCNIKFSNRLEEQEHNLLLSHHVKVAAKGAQNHNCAACSFTCSSLADYSKHVDTVEHRKRLERLRAVIDTENINCSAAKKMKGVNCDRNDSTYMEPASFKSYERPRESYSAYSYQRAYNGRNGYNNYRGGFVPGHIGDYWGERIFPERRNFDRNGIRASYHGERPSRNFHESLNDNQNKEKERCKSGPSSPHTEEPKKNMFQRACSMSIRRKDRGRKSNDEPEKKGGKQFLEKKIEKKNDKINKSATPFSPTRVSKAATAEAPKLKKKDVVPGSINIVPHDKEKAWKRIAKSVIGKKQSDLVRRDRASKYRLLEKKAEELSEEDGVCSEIIHPHVLPSILQNAISCSSMNDSSTYATVTAQIPISTPVNYATAMKAFSTDNADLNRVLNEIEQAKNKGAIKSSNISSASSSSTSTLPAFTEHLPPMNNNTHSYLANYNTPQQASGTPTDLITSSLSSDNNLLSSRVEMPHGNKPIKDEIEDDYFSIMPSITSPRISQRPSQDFDKKNELWDLAMEEELKKKELDESRARVLMLEADLQRIQKRKKELLDL